MSGRDPKYDGFLRPPPPRTDTRASWAPAGAESVDWKSWYASDAAKAEREERARQDELPWNEWVALHTRRSRGES